MQKGEGFLGEGDAVAPLFDSACGSSCVVKCPDLGLRWGGFGVVSRGTKEVGLPDPRDTEQRAPKFMSSPTPGFRI